jgi:uncharacterized membrane protein YidH (DUF202 family)
MNDPSSNPEPPEDPRVRFAAERTLLAWMRTGLALMGFGFVVARFGLFLREIAMAGNVAAHQHSIGWSLWISQSALPIATAQEGVLQAFHILNQFDIPKGSARGVEGGKEVADYTLWTGASDLMNLRYYFRTFENSRIRMIDLKQVNFNAKELKTIPMAGKEVIEDLSNQAK